MAALVPLAARADGGIPGSLGILLPADQPRTIGLATTFGLILSADAGATWSWTCEQQATTSMANLYAVGPPAQASGSVGDRFYALSPVEGLAYSDDQSCTWTTAAGFAPGSAVSDFFVDPSDPAHVLAVASARADGGTGSASVLASHDGGTSFGGAPLYSAPAGASIVGVEIARSDPNVIYVAVDATTAAGGPSPSLARSSDGGAHWTATDLTPSLGSAIVRILAVDPQDSALVYLRVIASGQDAVAVTRDGGGSVAVPIAFPGGQLSAFARLQSGTVLVGALLATPSGGTVGTAARSSDAAASFQAWSLPDPTHLVGLAERVENGHPRLYLSGKNYSDGWAVAVSDDEGLTLTPLMTYDRVKGVKACVQQSCQDSCQLVNSQGVWELSVCTGAAGAAGATGGSGGSPGQGTSGCGCGFTPTRPGRLLPCILCAAVLLGRRRRRRSHF